jgi:aspartate/methionine/tyrosine aminotransferase
VEGRQGVVHWQPPEEALAKIKSLIDEPTTSHYGADDGLPELRNALLEKVCNIQTFFQVLPT